MQEYNKKNLRRLIALFASVIIFFLALVAGKLSIQWWWASLPTSGAAIASAVLLFYHGFMKPDSDEEIK